MRDLVGQGDGTLVVLLPYSGRLGVIVVSHRGPAGLAGELGHAGLQRVAHHGRKMIPLSCRCDLEPVHRLRHRSAGQVQVARTGRW